MKTKTILLRIIQLLLVTILCLQVYSWTINITNTSIAYNKYESFLMWKERDIKASSDIEFLKKEALENIEIIRSKDREKHTTAGKIYFLLMYQAGLLLIVFVLSLFLKFKK